MLGACFLLACALALPPPAPAQARAPYYCSYGAAGWLVGHEIFVNRNALQPAADLHHRVPVPALPGCALNGVSARACDAAPPGVAVAPDLRAVRVTRRGPRRSAPTLDISLYCDPAPPPAP